MMMGMSIRRKVGSAGVRAIGPRVEKDLERAVDTSAHHLANTMKTKIESPPKTGRIYGAEQTVSFATNVKGGQLDLFKSKHVKFTAYKGKAGHQASAPGEAPATWFGQLVNSIGVEEGRAARLSRDVAARTRYAALLELGTTKMEPRPFMAPSVEEVRPTFEQLCATAFEKGLKG